MVVDVVEEMFNGNEAQKDNLAAPSAPAPRLGKSGKGRAGALVVKDLTHGWIVEVGTGMTDEDKSNWWTWVAGSLGVTSASPSTSFAHGMQDKPGTP